MKLLLLLIAVFSAFSLMATELSINGLTVKDVPIIKNGNQWNCIYQRELKDPEAANCPELLLNDRGWKKHAKHGHITGYNGDITLKMVFPGSVAELNAESVITNYADTKIRKSVIAWSLNGVDFTAFGEKEFGAGAGIVAGKTEIPFNNGIIWVRFSRQLDAGDGPGKSGFVIYSKIKVELKGTAVSD